MASTTSSDVLTATTPQGAPHFNGVIHEVTQAFKDFFLRSGAEADSRRARALRRVRRVTFAEDAI